jgi:hypothetical protein
MKAKTRLGVQLLWSSPSSDPERPVQFGGPGRGFCGRSGHRRCRRCAVAGSPRGTGQLAAGIRGHRCPLSRAMWESSEIRPSGSMTTSRPVRSAGLGTKSMSAIFASPPRGFRPSLPRPLRPSRAAPVRPVPACTGRAIRTCRSSNGSIRATTNCTCGITSATDPTTATMLTVAAGSEPTGERARFEVRAKPPTGTSSSGPRSSPSADRIAAGGRPAP